MMRYNLYKIDFYNGDGAIAHTIVAAKKDMKDGEVLDAISKEIASNYSEDKKFPYTNELVNQLKKTSTWRYFGTFEPAKDENSKNDDIDYFFISLQKTKNW